MGSARDRGNLLRYHCQRRSVAFICTISATTAPSPLQSLTLKAVNMQLFIIMYQINMEAIALLVALLFKNVSGLYQYETCAFDLLWSHLYFMAECHRIPYVCWLKRKINLV